MKYAPTEEEKRQFRAPCQISVEVIIGQAKTMAVTGDVGFHGVFIVHDKPPPPIRRLVQLVLIMRSGARVAAHGLVAHARQSSTGVAGFGVQILALDGQSRAAWDHFVHGLVRDSRKMKIAG